MERPRSAARRVSLAETGCSRGNLASTDARACGRSRWSNSLQRHYQRPRHARAPRWDTLPSGWTVRTTILDERLACRTDLMFDQGLAEEVRTSLRNGSKARGSPRHARWATRRYSRLDAGWSDDARRVEHAAPAATCDGSGPGFAETTGCNYSTPVASHGPRTPSTTPCGYGGT